MPRLHTDRHTDSGVDASISLLFSASSLAALPAVRAFALQLPPRSARVSQLGGLTGSVSRISGSRDPASRVLTLPVTRPHCFGVTALRLGFILESSDFTGFVVYYPSNLCVELYLCFL